jgi:hypothetical protein
VLIEVYLLRSQPDGNLAYRLQTGYLTNTETPDDAAVRIGAVPGDRAEAIVAVHSTSWRHHDDGTILLTYAVAPDPAPQHEATPIASFELAHGQHPHRPSPQRVTTEQVAAHAARHLALLATTDPQVSTALITCPPLHQALTALPAMPAGQLASPARPARHAMRRP